MNNPNHPSFDTSCPVQYSVRPAPTAWTMSGFGCGVTGGHCIPGDYCSSRRETHNNIQSEKSMIAALKGQQHDK